MMLDDNLPRRWYCTSDRWGRGEIQWVAPKTNNPGCWSCGEPGTNEYQPAGITP